MNEILHSAHNGVGVDVSQHESDFAKWEQELHEPVEENVSDFPEWELEFNQKNDESSLEAQVLESPEEPQTAWVDSNPDGTITEAQYRQKSYWVIGQYGHAMDVIKDSITTDQEAEEWLEMKMTILAAKAQTDPYELAGTRMKMIPIWYEYIIRMNVDWEAFARVANK